MAQDGSGESWLKRAMRMAKEGLVGQAQGLYVPDYVAGQHYGGISGYEPWIQDCIYATFYAVRKRPGQQIGPEEMSELTSLVMWDEPSPTVVIEPHAVIVRELETYFEWASEKLNVASEMTDKAKEQVRRAHGTRELGTILVVGLRWLDSPKDGGVVKELRTAVSAWRTAAMDEALANPPRKYAL